MNDVDRVYAALFLLSSVKDSEAVELATDILRGWLLKQEVSTDVKNYL
jgi:hypothetical protein